MPCQSSSQVPGCPKCVAWKWPPSSCSHQVLLLQPLYTWSGSLQQDILIDTHLSRCVFAGSFSTLAVQQMGSTKQWGKTNCCCWRQHERVARKRTNTTNSDATRLQNDSMFYIMLLKSVNHHTATSARWWKQNRHVWSHYQHTTAGAHVMSSLDPPRVHVPNEQLGVSFSLASLLDLMMFIYHLEIDHEDLGRVHLVNETSL